MFRYLIIEGYALADRDKLELAGMSLASQLFADMLLAWQPGAVYDVFMPCDEGSSLPRPLADYDGILWTGTTLTIFELDDPRVVRMIELGQEIFEVGVPAFGSCWGVQMAAAAAGGQVTRSPLGREMGVARKIAQTDAGLAHPFMAGKPRVFDAFISHYDEVTTVPEGGVVLAGNRYTSVQAMAVRHANGEFWATQYHVEYNLHEMSRLLIARENKLLPEGFFRGRQELVAMADGMEALWQEPGRKDLRWQLAIDDDLIDPALRQIEFGNWLTALVVPTAQRRRG
jgi:GMP synthase (glutamine-hydrolysing)